MTEEITIDPSSLESIAEAIAAGVTTPELVADWIGVDLIDDCVVLDDSSVFADAGNSELEYTPDSTFADAAKDYVESGDWDYDNSTSWVTVHVYRKGVNSHGKIVRIGEESHTVTIDPTAPDCVDGGDHIWHSPYSLLGGLKENPGVQGNGGGIVSKEICRCCGCARVTDTWARNPETGQQGLTSVEYTEGEYADEMVSRAIARAKSRLDTGDSPADGFDFCWTTERGLVGCSEDDLRDYGIALARDEDAAPISGTPVE